MVSTDFWSTTAQVIPALLLVYVVERRFSETDGERPGPAQSIFVSAVVSLAVVSEFLALRGLSGHGGLSAARTVIMTLGVLLTLICGTFLAEYGAESVSGQAGGMRNPRAMGLAGSVAILAMLVAVLLPLVVAVWVAATL